MSLLLKTTHLSEILEKSEKGQVTIFKHSSNCYSSDVLKKEIETAILDKKIQNTVYIVTVQDSPVLSKKIEEVFGIKHETPQIINLKNNKAIYSASHQNIDINNIAKSPNIL